VMEMPTSRNGPLKNLFYSVRALNGTVRRGCSKNTWFEGPRGRHRKAHGMIDPWDLLAPRSGLQ